MIKVSVIIPYYNTEIYQLKRAVKSVLDHNMEEIEIIIVDDGSDYQFEKELDEINQMDEHIVLIHQNNRGVSAARNNGIKHAIGEYITFLDSDDEFAPGFLQTAFENAKKNNADVVLGATKEIFQEKKEEIKAGSGKIVSVTDKNNLKRQLVSDPYEFSCGGYLNRGIAGRFIKKTLASEIRFRTNIVIAEDLLYTIDVVEKCNKVILIDKICYLYHHNAGSVTHRYNPNIVKESLKHLMVLRNHFDLENKEDFVAYVDRVLYIYKTICDCWINNEKCNIKWRNKRKILKNLKKKKPWELMLSRKYYMYASYRTRVKILGIRSNLILIYWKLAR